VLFLGSAPERAAVPKIPEDNEITKQMFTAIANLSNAVSAEGSSRTLKKYFYILILTNFLQN
jgi:hypothetical protein